MGSLKKAPQAVRVDRELEAGSRAHYDDAAYYTATYAGRIEDVQMYVDLAVRAGSVLEYGVGNGRIALPVARHGVKVTGVDHSAPMLADLKERVSREPREVQARVTLKNGDMRSLSLGSSPSAKFPLIICPFNTLLHLYTRDDVERFLARVHRHLRPGGRFVMDLSVPLAENLARDPDRAYGTPPFRHAGTGDVVRYKEHFDYDPIRQVLFVSMDFSARDNPANSWMTPLAHRQFYPQEWEALLHYNGFAVDDVFGDFYGGPLVKDSDVMVWHVRTSKKMSK